MEGVKGRRNYLVDAILNKIAELFGTKRPAIAKHLLNIFTSGELDEDSVCSILEYIAADGKTYE